MATDEPPPEMTCGTCGAPLVCFLCESCEEHCITDGNPDACWEAHESWRTGGPDPTFATIVTSIEGTGRPRTLNGVPIPAAPRPRKLS